MINLKLLKEFIDRKGYTLADVAHNLNVSYVTVYNKMRGKTEFTLREALALKRILDLTQSEWNAVFDEE